MAKDSEVGRVTSSAASDGFSWVTTDRVNLIERFVSLAHSRRT